LSSANEVIRRISRITKQEYELETKETVRGYISSARFVGRNEDLDWLKGMWKRIIGKSANVRKKAKEPETSGLQENREEETNSQRFKDSLQKIQTILPIKKN